MRPPLILLSWAAAAVLLGLAGCGSPARDALERGDAVFEKGQLDAAILFYSDAIRLDPQSKQAYESRGSAYLEKGDYQEAIADCTEAIRLDPDAASAYSQRGLAYLRLAEYAKAIADLDEAIQRLPRAIEARLWRAEAHLGQRNYEKALADADRAVAARPHQTGPLLLRGRAFAGGGDLQRAEADFSEAIRLDQSCAYAYWNRARVRRDLGKADEAARDQRRAEYLDPGFKLHETGIGSDVIAGLRGRQESVVEGRSLDPSLENRD